MIVDMATMNQWVEQCLGNDGVVDQTEAVAILNQALSDGVQDVEIQASRALLQQSQQILLQAQQQLAYAQAYAGQGQVINRYNLLEGLANATINSAAYHNAVRQVNVAQARVNAYAVIDNELRARASWWQKLWN